ncbi:MAG TPA: DUF1501 domain-containing protein [Planctomycetaceae bacterium]|nr:DUF1501 domain-containing protein [Planctomycetaceae bacterium]
MPDRTSHSPVLDSLGLSRRDMLARSGTGLGALGLAGVLFDAGLLCESPARASGRSGPAPLRNPLAARPPHFTARAKHVIHVYLNGGPSQIDTFDPKPLLKKYDGRPLPTGNLTTERPTGGALPSPFRFRQYGESGLEISELFEQTARHADKLCVLRSMYANTPNHEQSMRLMNTGDERLSRPSLGSWLMYGLGTENQNLPGFVAMCPGLPVSDVSNWRSAFLPGIFQGTYINTTRTKVDELIENIRNAHVSRADQRRQLDLLAALNRQHHERRAEDAALEARIESFELAYRMQFAATDAFDVSQEPKHIQDAYGSHVQGRQLLIARRLVERGVRFVQCYHGNVQPWDSHSEIEKNHRNLALECDGAIAALLTDLEQRGLLDETLVLCGGEFGRTPAVELPQPGTGETRLGRDHNHWGFSVWLAGGGVKGGMTYGATDEFGYRAVENRVHVHDLHATMLHLLGFDHERLTYRHAGRDFRLTDVHGRVVREIVA